MTLYAGISARHVNSYHQDNSLLFQFILAEFLEAYTEIQKFDTLCNRMPELKTNETQSIRYSERELPIIQETINRLVGPSRDYMRLFSWNFSEGALLKLRTYCALFVQNADMDEKELMAIQHYAEKICQHCFAAADSLHEIPIDFTSLFSSLEKANTAMQRFSKQIIRHIHQFKNDENVIFFILRNHSTFDKLCGNRFVARLLAKMYPKGMKDALTVLTNKYSQRNFENMLPAIYAAASAAEGA